MTDAIFTDRTALTTANKRVCRFAATLPCGREVRGSVSRERIRHLPSGKIITNAATVNWYQDVWQYGGEEITAAALAFAETRFAAADAMWDRLNDEA